MLTSCHWAHMKYMLAIREICMKYYSSTRPTGCSLYDGHIQSGVWVWPVIFLSFRVATTPMVLEVFSQKEASTNCSTVHPCTMWQQPLEWRGRYQLSRAKMDLPGVKMTITHYLESSIIMQHFHFHHLLWTHFPGIKYIGMYRTASHYCSP